MSDKQHEDGPHAATPPSPLPYISLPIAYTDPSRLAALATLHGLAAPAAASARVLELGCASGGNIIPLAARRPRSRSLGIDLSDRHIAIGHARIAALGLDNVRLMRADIATLGLPDDLRFDIIVCHGVYSWVPATARAAMLTLCGKHLAPDGLCAISFNVLPGWHLRQAVRHICRAEDDAAAPPMQRATALRALLADVARTSNDTTPYGRLMRREAASLSRMPASYLLGEFLVEHNEPVAFRDFAAEVARHGLAYLCEGDIATTLPETLLPAAATRIHQLANTQADTRLGVQHYLDLFSGRPFRRAVLVRSGRIGAASALEAAAQRLAGLHLAATRLGTRAPARPAPAAQAPPPASDRTLARLAAVAPATLPVADLVHGDEPCSVADIWALIRSGRAVAHSEPIVVGRAPPPLGQGQTARARLHAFAPARQDAAAGQPWATSLAHAAAPIDASARLLLPLLDGSRTLRDLVDLVAAQAAPEAGGGVRQAETLVQSTLTQLASAGLLMPD